MFFFFVFSKVLECFFFFNITVFLGYFGCCSEDFFYLWSYCGLPKGFIFGSSIPIGATPAG